MTEGDGRCLVLAGAGSGKTRTVTYRTAYLLDQGVKPSEILLVTFTNKAADEMVERVRQLTDLRRDLPWAGTFHSIAYKILREYGNKLGYEDNFTVLDSSDSEKLIKRVLDQLNIDQGKDSFPKASTIQSIISFARNSKDTIENVMDLKYQKYLDHVDTIEHLAEEYSQRKQKANAMDFDDLLVNLSRLLKNNEDLKKKFSKQFKYVLADEYQDTNQLQDEILKLFSEHHGNLLVVGDDAQSIYSFRAADISNILEFEDEFENTKIFKLETNYRSTPKILELANETIKNNTNQHEKELTSTKETTSEPKIEELSNRRREAEYIADEMERLESNGVGYSEMASLFRASHHSQALEMELNQRGIPYEFRGGMRFFERAHIKDTLAYLRALVNPKDTTAWDRVLTQHTGIGPKTSAKIINRIQSLDTLSKLEDVKSGLNSRAQEGWNSFFSIWSEIAADKEEGPAELIKALKDSRYKNILKQEYENHKERLKDIKQLASTAFSIVDSDDSPQEQLQQFLAEASLQQKYEADESEDKAVLSTIHQAKGLEWSSVFIMNLAKRQFPNERALDKPSGLEEERRLFYVALTRAKEHLYLTYPLSSVTSNRKFQKPSQFIKEVEHLIEDEQAEQIEANGGYTYELEEDSNGGFLSDIDEL